MNVRELIREVQACGASVEVVGDMLALDMPEDFPEDLIERLGQAKAEVIEHLRREGMARRYRQVFPDKHVRDAEIAEIERQVHSYGVCLTWCEVLDDFVAFCQSEDDRGRVPQDFVAYLLSELDHLFAEDGESVGADTLSPNPPMDRDGRREDSGRG